MYHTEKERPLPTNHHSTDMNAMHSTRKLYLSVFSVCKFSIERATPLLQSRNPIFLDHFEIYYFELGHEGSSVTGG
jgi:hypothetical protein